ncbi:hypothetical protein [Maribacter polysaccharolyticus]|uniref:hypothetical protein n=1 Tax=Maribacter polysaccharolyticus TaxID=3020831 RepID=UPI00237F2F66|nr:hypothetical protein [Maribacter polysaccharolyticus]MDE3742372.1 hypothetical protein [Maribacter polysaccharolyticus]
MKYLILFIVIASFGSIIYGFNILEDQESLGHKCIGLGTAGIFLLAMPLFLFKASKGKKMKDYMLTEENIKKMKEEKAEKPENQ